MKTASAEKRATTVGLRISLLLLFLLCGASVSAQFVNCSKGVSSGNWSKTAVNVSQSTLHAYRTLTICSPDHAKAFQVKDESWQLATYGDKGWATSTQKQLFSYDEIGWSPDGRAFYLIRSEGYSTGYETNIYRVENGRFETVHGINHSVSMDFERRHACRYWDAGVDVGNRPNIAAVKWMDTDRILMVAEVPPISICDNMEYFGGYLFSIKSRRIVKRYSPEQVRDILGDQIGPRLEGDFAQISEDLRKTIP